MPRGMTKNMLTPLRHFWEGSHLVCNAKVAPSEEALSEYGAIPAGRAMHLTNATGPNDLPVAKLGCDGNEKVPVFIYRPSDSYSVGYEGPDPATELGPSWVTEGDERGVLMFVGMEGFELATTEFNSARTYKVGEYLRAPEHDTGAPDAQVDVRTVAGVLTNDTVVNGVDTIIGVVSPGVNAPMAAADGTDEYGNQTLSFYTTYRPPIAGLLNGTPVNVARA